MREGGRREALPRSVWVASIPLALYICVPLVALLFVVPPTDLARHLASPMAVRALWLTLKTTVIATSLVVVLGTPLAFMLARGSFRGRELLDTLVDLPITIPPVVAGVALLLAFGRRGLIGRQLELFGVEIPFTSVAVVMAQLFIASPFFVKAASAGFEAVDSRLEAAARTLGASRWRVFWTISVPLARPALLSGVVLAWARALSEFGATMMFAGNFPGRTQTLTLAVMSALESDLETAVAVSVLSLALAVTALLGAKWLAGQWRVPLA
ncbi:MAG TPA: ABC transporter permease [Vicinamibacteria bacterium]|nr:ABC transporter permease [Vicinamibacteria bacterium]